MNGPGRRFDPSELRGGADPEPTSAELAEALSAARVLEAHASDHVVRPSAGFEDRVMAAIATEPAPRVVVRSGSAMRGGRPAAFVLALRDAWGIATSGGRPTAVRAQAFGLVLLMVVAAGSLTGVAAVGVGSLLAPRPSPAPSLPVPSAPPVLVSPSSSPSPSESPEVTGLPSDSPEPSDSVAPIKTPGSTETPEPTGTSEPAETPTPTETVKPGETPKPGETARPTETPDASDDGGRSKGLG